MKDPNVISNLRMISGDKWTVVGMLQLATHFLKSKLMLILIKTFSYSLVFVQYQAHSIVFERGELIPKKKRKKKFKYNENPNSLFWLLIKNNSLFLIWLYES